MCWAALGPPTVFSRSPEEREVCSAQQQNCFSLGLWHAKNVFGEKHVLSLWICDCSVLKTNNPHLENVQPYKDTITRNQEEEYSGERQAGNLYFQSSACIWEPCSFFFLIFLVRRGCVLVIQFFRGCWSYKVSKTGCLVFLLILLLSGIAVLKTVVLYRHMQGENQKFSLEITAFSLGCIFKGFMYGSKVFQGMLALTSPWG